MLTFLGINQSTPQELYLINNHWILMGYNILILPTNKLLQNWSLMSKVPACQHDLVHLIRTTLRLLQTSSINQELDHIVKIDFWNKNSIKILWYNPIIIKMVFTTKINEFFLIHLIWVRSKRLLVKLVYL